MQKNKRISVLLAASVTAIVFWICATFVVPALSFTFLLLGAAPAQLSGFAAIADHGMLFAMIIPVCVAVLGFFNGSFIALIYNALMAEPLAPKATRENRREEPIRPGRLFPMPALAQRLLEPQAVLARSHAVGR
jgi:hypothetical protein